MKEKAVTRDLVGAIENTWDFSRLIVGVKVHNGSKRGTVHHMVQVPKIPNLTISW